MARATRGWQISGAGQQASALGRLAVLQQTSVLPTVTSYNAAISACDICRQWQQALGVLAAMRLMLFCPLSFPKVPPPVLVKMISRGNRPSISWQ